MSKKLLFLVPVLLVVATELLWVRSHQSTPRDLFVYGNDGKQIHYNAEGNELKSSLNASSNRWGLCNPFSELVEIEELVIPSLKITAFFLSCSIQGNDIVLTTFLEKIPPKLPLSSTNYHAQMASNYKDVKLLVSLEGSGTLVSGLECGEPVKRADAVTAFYCQAKNKSDRVALGTIKSGISATVKIKAQGIENGKETVLSLCRKKDKIRGTAMCVTYIPVVGENWMRYYREYIEYHRIIGVDRIYMFEHTKKHKEAFEKYYHGSNFATRVQWPPLTSRPDLFYNVITEFGVNITRECYDQTLIDTYCVLNSDYKWAFSMDADEYIWNKKPERSLLSILETESPKASRILLPMVVFLRGQPKEGNLVIEDNNFECKIRSYGKSVYKTDETYGLNIHTGTTKGGSYESKSLSNLHFRGMYIMRNPVNMSICKKTDAYSKPYAAKIREALQKTSLP